MKRIFVCLVLGIALCGSLSSTPLKSLGHNGKRTCWEWRHSKVGLFCYGGINPLGLVFADRYRFYGLQCGIGYRLLGLEYTWWKMGDEIDNYLDLQFKGKKYDEKELGVPIYASTRWNLGITYYDVGHETDHINVNLYLLYEQESRSYYPLQSIVRTDEIGPVIDSFAVFRPKQKGYQLYYGATVEYHWSIVYVRGGFGLGLGLRQFEVGGTYPDESTFFENPLLEYRRPSRVSLLLRGNVAVGIMLRMKRKS